MRRANVRIAKELTAVARELAAAERCAKYPSKAMDYNKVPDTDGFWAQSIGDAKRRNGLRFAPKEIGDLIMFLNMAAQGWKRIGG